MLDARAPMQAQAPAAGAPTTPLVAVRFDRLLLPYAIVPLSLIFVAIDALALRGRLAAALPQHPDRLAFFTLFFNFPHIVASHIILLDREYLKTYWRRIAGAALVIVTLTLLLRVAGPAWSAPAILLVTAFHILSQQVGLTGAQLRTKDWSFPAWKWLTIVLGVGSFQLALSNPAGGPAERLAGLAATLVLAVPWVLIALRLSGRSATASGKRYLWANQALIAVGIGVSFAGYPLFGLLMPRVVHDLTAFYVYGVHDTNRNAGRPPNALYAASSRLGLPPWLVGPVVAVVFAFWAEHLSGPNLSLHLVYWMSAFHYYLEGVVWRGGSIHRQSAPFR
jgi:hypothetical protein